MASGSAKKPQKQSCTKGSKEPEAHQLSFSAGAKTEKLYLILSTVQYFKCEIFNFKELI